MTDTDKQAEQYQRAIEAAFREGYKAGYDRGQDDQCQYEWGAGGGSAGSRDRAQDREWSESDAIKTCPRCGGSNTDTRHAEGSMFICETDWRQCEDCEFQWGHQ